MPIIGLHIPFCNFIYFFNATLLAFVNNLPTLFSIINQSTSDHSTFTQATSVSRLVVHVNGSQAKWTMISVASILQWQHVLVTNCTNKMYIFIFFAHFLPFLKLFKQRIKKVGFRLGLPVKHSHRAYLSSDKFTAVPLGFAITFSSSFIKAFISSLNPNLCQFSCLYWPL